MPGLRDMGRWPEYTAQGLQGGNGKRPRSVRRLHQTLPQLLGLGHDLWIVSERVDLVDLFVDVPDDAVCVGQVGNSRQWALEPSGRVSCQSGVGQSEI